MCWRPPLRPKIILHTPTMTASHWHHRLPFLSWPRLSGKLLHTELFAGLSVGLMVIPQGVAYAALAGMPLITGIYASLLPALVAGSAATGVDLPSVDLDYRAVCRHAAGLLRAKGCRRPVLLLPNTAAPGDAESAEGFLEGFPTARVLRHDGTPAGLCRQVRSVCTGREGADALVVGRSVHALTALTCLLAEGLRVPRDVALIARDGDAFLAHAVPAPARYVSDPRRWSAAVARLVLRLAEGGRTRSQHRLMPDFVAGGTL